MKIGWKWEIRFSNGSCDPKCLPGRLYDIEHAFIRRVEYNESSSTVGLVEHVHSFRRDSNLLSRERFCFKKE